MTPAEIIYHRRVRLLELATELGNVSEACRQMGVSRKSYYQWLEVVADYGLEALMPKGRRRPQQANETPTHVVADLLAVAVVEPTLGCRQLADRLDELGYRIGKTTVQRILVSHGLGRRRQRIARAASWRRWPGSSPSRSPRSTGAVRVLPLGRPSRRSRGLGQLLHRQPQRGRQGLPTHRDRHLHPLGDRETDHRAGHHRGHDPVHRPRPQDHAPPRCPCPPCPDRQRTRIQRTRCSAITWPRSASITSGSRHGHPTTTPCANDSRAPCSKSAGAQPSTAAGSYRCANSKPKPTPGSSATTPAAATTATTWPAARPADILDNHHPNQAA